MKKKMYLCLLVATGCIACTSSVKKNIREADEMKEDLKEDYREEVVQSPNADVLDDVDVDPKIVRPDIVDRKVWIDIYKAADQTISVEFASYGNHMIRGKLASDDPTANIRVSQIVMPDDSTDGPFGKEFSYNLPADGNYKLLIHEDMMAGDPWAGIFTIQFDLIPNE